MLREEALRDDGIEDDIEGDGGHQGQEDDEAMVQHPAQRTTIPFEQPSKEALDATRGRRARGLGLEE